MDSCCENKASELAALKVNQSKVLKIVLVINATMFFVEAGAGVWIRSTALLADSLDMLGDALVYAFSLYVLHKEKRWQVSAAALKGLIMLAFGVAVLFEAILKVASGVIPEAQTMGLVGVLVLIANSACLALLLRHRNDDINMRSTWRCSRNDIIANVSTIAAAGAVAITDSHWPDVIVGGSIAILFLLSAVHTLKETWGEWRLSPDVIE